MRREGLASVDELQSYFIRRVEAIFRRHSRRLLGWDEIMDGDWRHPPRCCTGVARKAMRR
jgi:N-acetyl-beta-hexosaminidase